MKSIFLKLAWALFTIFAVFAYVCLDATILAAKTIRKVEMGSEKVIVVKTALGYSTIIEFPDKPVSAVVGDQDAFKVEYIGKSLTIKPLVPNAKSNLFVFTEQDRFNCTLLTGSPSEVDYLVRVVHKAPVEVVANSPPETSTKRVVVPFNRKQIHDGFGLRVLNYTKLFDSEGIERALEIKFELFSLKKTYDFSGRSIGIRQNNQFLNIESLFLGRARLTAGESPVPGKILVLSTSVSRKKPLLLVFAVPSEKTKDHVFRLSIDVLGGAAKGKKL